MNISDVLIVNSLNTISVNCKQQQVVRIIINTSSMVLYVPYRTQPWNRAYCFPHAIDRRYKQHLYVLGTTVVYSIYQDIHQLSLIHI